MPKMTPSEALVETLVAEGIKNVFGIVGSAFMMLWTSFLTPVSGLSWSHMNRPQRMPQTAMPG